MQLSSPRTVGLSERDAILITYGDQLREPDVPPLRALADFCEKYLSGIISGIHILPFYPWTSDDGFSIKDYRTVDPALGNWDDVVRVGRNFQASTAGFPTPPPWKPPPTAGTRGSPPHLRSPKTIARSITTPGG